MNKLPVFLLLILTSSCALAQVDSRPLSDAERTEKLGRAERLKDEASREQKAADAALKAENDACYKRFQVNACLEEAKKKHTAATREAERKELEGDELARDVKRRDVAAKDAKKAADAPVREAKQKEQGEAYRADEAARAQKRADKMASKEAKAAAGRQKHAEDQVRRQKKLEDQAKKEAKAAEKRAKREARAAAREAEKAKAANP
jgi:colicin import membrane protein